MGAGYALAGDAARQATRASELGFRLGRIEQQMVLPGADGDGQLHTRMSDTGGGYVVAR